VEVQRASRATILHADLDAFYASVEQLLDPSLRNRPIAVGGSVVLAASYEARRYGVRGGMPGWRARQLCGDLLFVGGHFGRYQQFGDDVVSVFHDFTPRVERVSIDEAFLDVAGAVHLFGAPIEIAAAIRRRVRDEIGLPLSIGIARTKHLAKVASQVAKPDGLVAVAPHDEGDFLDPLPIGLYGESDQRPSVGFTRPGSIPSGNWPRSVAPYWAACLDRQPGQSWPPYRPTSTNGQWRRRPNRSPWVPRPPSDGAMQLQSSSERHSATWLTEWPAACARQTWQVGQ
jgi:impB/mucB/samB family